MEFELRQKILRIRQKYPEGTRIRLIQMGDDPRPIESGTEGTVLSVDDIGTVHCCFDNGRILGLIIDEDDFEIVETEKCDVGAERR